MTYAEVAQVLGLPSARAALQRSRRGGWPRRQHNDDKLVRVGVPASVLAASRDPSRPPAASLVRAGRSNAREVTGEVTPGSVMEPQALGALADALRQERERREAAEAAAAQAQGEAAGFREAIRLAEDNTRRADLAAEEAGRREAAAMTRCGPGRGSRRWSARPTGAGAGHAAGDAAQRVADGRWRASRWTRGWRPGAGWPAHSPRSGQRGRRQG
jgi:hypothetical protein